MKKTHWLYGRGPDKILDFKKEIDEESDCSKCIHREVCSFDMSKRCENYTWGTSEHASTSCHSCSRRFTRFDEHKVPCFTCPWFEARKEDAVAKDGAQ